MYDSCGRSQTINFSQSLHLKFAEYVSYCRQGLSRIKAKRTKFSTRVPLCEFLSAKFAGKPKIKKSRYSSTPRCRRVCFLLLVRFFIEVNVFPEFTIAINIRPANYLKATVRTSDAATNGHAASQHMRSIRPILYMY